MKKIHDVSDVKFINSELVLKIDGVVKRFPVAQVSKRLQNASEKERNNFEVTPSGYGIHWPALDEDLSIDGLLGINHERGRNEIAA